MRNRLLVSLLIPLLGACAVRLGGTSPVPYGVAALTAGANVTPAQVAERLREAGADIALVSATRDSAWFAAVAEAAELELSGPGTTGPRGMAFLAPLELLGDTSIVLSVPSGGRIHMHDALYRVDEDRLLDLMMVDVDSVQDLRDGVRTLLSYIATDVGNSVPLVLAVTAPTTAVDDSVAVLLRAAFANARECGARSTNDNGDDRPSGASVPLELLYGPIARMQCETASILEGAPSGIGARLIIGR